MAKRKKPVVHYLAVWGCVSTGLVYAAIGLVAVLSFLHLKDGGADEASLLVYLHDYWLGKIFIWVVLTGMVAYIARRVYETVYDPYRYGSDLKGIARRTATALSGFADALIASSAVQALLGSSDVEANGIPTALRHLVGRALEESWGPTLLVLIGATTVITALIQFGYVMTKSYLERMDLERFGRWKKIGVDVAAWAGHFARGIVLGVIGVSFIRAVVTHDPTFVVNTDKAFDFIGDNVGGLAFNAVAAGTIAYGVFMVLFGFCYDSHADKKASAKEAF